jgi:sodium/bile acid cotransporter 7
VSDTVFPFLRKHWFLLLILLGTLLVIWQPGWLAWTVWLNPTVCGSVAILCSAWTLESRRLGHAMLHPWPAVWALVISYGLLPALAVLSGPLLDSPDYRIGLLLITSVPCTLASAVIWTRLAGGEEATALLITFLTNCTSWLATTAWLTLGVGSTVPGMATGPLMFKLVLVLIVPVGVGQMLRLLAPMRRIADEHKPALSVAARLLTATVMLKAAVEVRKRFDDDRLAPGMAALTGVAVLCVLIHLLALGAGFWTSRVLGLHRSNQIAVAIGGSQKTLPIALILFDAYFASYPLAVVPIVAYHFGQLIADTFIAQRLVDTKRAEHPTWTEAVP